MVVLQCKTLWIHIILYKKCASSQIIIKKTRLHLPLWCSNSVFILFAILTFQNLTSHTSLTPKYKFSLSEKLRGKDAVLRHACGCKATSRKYELSALRMIVSIKQKTLR